MPHLGGDHGGKSHFHGETRERAGFHLPEGLSPVEHFLDVEVTGATQRFLAQELADEFGLGIEMEAVERRTEDDLLSRIHRGWQPAFGEKAQDVFVPEATQLPTRMKGRGEVED